MANFGGGHGGTGAPSGGGRGGAGRSGRTSIHAQANSSKAARGAGVRSHQIGAQQVGDRWGRANAYRNTNR